jgi:hypothetical protein
MTKKYKIIKFRKSGTQKVMEKNLSLDEAKRYCSRPDTKGKNWFCGFTQQKVPNLSHNNNYNNNN